MFEKEFATIVREKTFEKISFEKKSGEYFFFTKKIAVKDFSRP